MSAAGKDVFCNGGMDMLMHGFETHKTAKTCIILWFPSWVLNTPFKFGMACIGVFFIGFAIEVLISYRRKITRYVRRTFYTSYTLGGQTGICNKLNRVKRCKLV